MHEQGTENMRPFMTADFMVSKDCKQQFHSKFFLIHTFSLLTVYNFDRTNLLAGRAENKQLSTVAIAE